MNANMRRRGQKRRGRSEKGGHFVGGCCMLYPPNGHKVEHPDTWQEPALWAPSSLSWKSQKYRWKPREREKGFQGR